MIQKSLIFVSLLSQAAAFVPSGVRSRGWIQPQDRATFRRQATIFSPDGTRSDFSSDGERNRYNNDPAAGSAWHVESHVSYASTALLQKLHEHYLTSLVKVACAFSPAGRVLRPREVETVQVLDLDKSRIEINAVLCEAEGCVSVAVPVDFPMPCQDSEDMELCVLDNISRLDATAEGVIATAEWKDVNHEEVEAMERIRQTMMDKTNIVYPSWWTTPESMSYDMALECRSLCDLLNEEDFRDDVNSIAKQALESSTGGAVPLDLRQSGVVEVGPAGLLMRAHLKQEKTFDDESGFKIVDVHIPFVSVCSDEAALRSSILGFISE